MTVVLRRALALALLLTGLVLVVVTPRSDAAPQDCTRTMAEAAEAAEAVFVGVVTEVQRTGGDARAAVYTNSVHVELVLEGSIEQASVPVLTSAATRARPGLGPLEPRERYLFFVRTGNGALSAGGCSGTRVAGAQQVTRIQELLGEGRPAVPPAPPEAEFTPVAESDPVDFTRSAAPGLALVLVGLLGLFVVRRLGRR